MKFMNSFLWLGGNLKSRVVFFYRIPLLMVYLSYTHTIYIFFSKRIISHMSKEFVYHTLGGISSVAARPVAAGMMLKQRETILAATGVTSSYEGVLPYPKVGLRATQSPAAWGRGLGGKEQGTLSSGGCRQKEVPFLERGLSNITARSPALS